MLVFTNEEQCSGFDAQQAEAEDRRLLTIDEMKKYVKNISSSARLYHVKQPILYNDIYGARFVYDTVKDAYKIVDKKSTATLVLTVDMDYYKRRSKRDRWLLIAGITVIGAIAITSLLKGF